MAEGNGSEDFSKSRSVLGDLTNRLGKRGSAERDKNGIKTFNFKEITKRICVAPRPCTEINSLKGNIVSSISKIPNENRDPNVPDSGNGFALSKRSNDIETDSNDGHCLKGKNGLMGNSFRGGIAIPRSIDELNVDNDSVDSGHNDYFEDDAVPRMDKMASQNCEGLNLTDTEGGRVVNSIAIEADDCSKLDLAKENEIPGIAETVSENKFTSLNHTFKENEIDLTINAGGEISLASSKVSYRENVPSLTDLDRGDNSFLSDTSRTVSETGGDCLHDGKDIDTDEPIASLEGTQSDINYYQNEGDDHNGDHLVMSQCGSIDCTFVPESQESRAFEVERPTELKKGDECAYTSGGLESIKDCPCSFCTKAGYIWLDLNYQDIKARVSAMKKSQKEANILAERSITGKDIEKHVAESFGRVSKLEYDLMHQWRSLFQHMADIWEEEANQLEARLQPLTDLREKCKTDLQFINGTMSEKH